MIIKSLLILFFILGVSVLSLANAEHNDSLFEYLRCKTYNQKLKNFSEAGVQDSAIFYANKIFASSDKTFCLEANVFLSRLYFSLRYNTISAFDLSQESLKERFITKFNNIESCLLCVDKAVKSGLTWHCIDETILKVYPRKRYSYYREQYLLNTGNVELINLIEEIGVSDQSNRKGVVDQKQLEFDDSINCNKLSNWLVKNGWPQYHAISVENSVCWTNESSSMLTYTRHFDRESLLFFLDLAYESALNGYSSWNQVFDLEISQLNRFSESLAVITEEKSVYISPLLRTFTKKDSGHLDLENSFFEILAIAEISQNYKIAIFPSIQFYKVDPKNAYTQMKLFYDVLEDLGASATPFDIFNTSTFSPLSYLPYIQNYDSQASFILILISEKDKNVSWTVPNGYPTILENKDIGVDEISSIFSK